MDIPNLHDGFFDGFRIKPNKVVQLFLRTSDEKTFAFILGGVRAMRISGVMNGNIILDVIVRSGQQITLADICEVYSLADAAPQAPALLAAAREQGLQLMELNPSYGAEGLLLFGSLELAADK